MFTSDQLAEIKKATLSRIICTNADDIDQVQPDAFHRINETYGMESCNNDNQIPVLDLNAWREGKRQLKICKETLFI